MAKINFPEPQANGEIFDKDGVLYQYSGTPGSGFWKANSQNVVDDAYINTSGDVMSGDLTLSGLSGLGEAILGVDANGKLVRGNALSTFTSPYVLKTGDFLSGTLTLEDNLGNSHVVLNHQTGDALFTGKISVGSFDIDNPSGSPSSTSGGGIKDGKLYVKGNTSNESKIYEGFDNSGTVTSSITGHGDANFRNIQLANGQVQSPFFRAGGALLSSYAGSGTIYPVAAADATEATKFGVTTSGEVHIGGSLDTIVSTPTILLKPDGSASFSDQLSATSISTAGIGSFDGGVSIGSYGITQNGSGTFTNVACTSTTASSADLGSITGTSLDLSGLITSTGGASFSGNIDVTGAVSVTEALTAASGAFTGAISASNYGAVTGSSADFTSALSANSATITQNLSAATVTVSGPCDVGSLSSVGALNVQSTGSFTNDISCDGLNSTNTISTTVTLPTDPAVSVTQGGTVNAIISGNGQASFASNNLTISANGDVENINNSYGAISDKKFKTNIVNASSQWNDIKNISLVNYQFKPSYGFGSNKYLGVVAQDLRNICPALVETKDDVQQITTPEFDEFGMPVIDEHGNQKSTTVFQKMGTQTQSVKYSVLYLKALGALQEAMDRIESLEAEVKQLKSN